MKTIKQTMRIEKIEEIETHTKNKDREMYRLVGKDNTGIGTCTLNFPTSFDGFKPDEIIEIEIKTSQLSLEDFKPEEEAGDE